jgi:aminoglycoside phosphotransferase family enzyme/predicted kinase
MSIPTTQRAVAAFLTQLAGGPPRETHVSAVFVGTDAVWKLKKAVRFDFLDFSSPAQREAMLRRELTLNRRTAPELYRDVVPVRRDATSLSLGDGAGEVVDWVLRMAPIPAADFFDAIAARDALTPELLDAGLDAAQVAVWRAEVRREIDTRRAWLTRRAAAGFVRHAHGDLHLGNLCLWHGRPVLFDALEFDDALATIDLGYDLAFLLMDLDRRAGRAAANHVLNRYVARRGDAATIPGLPLYLSQRAMVRAHVQASRGEADSSAYLAAAQAYLRLAPGLVVAVGGLPGTGKSTLARALAPTLGAAPGALVLRSDETRKRLYGQAPEERLGAEAYDAAANARTDAALLDMLRDTATAAQAVIVDATCIDPGFRAALAAAAKAAGRRFLGLWLQAPQDELERRIAARGRDASDATIAVLRRLRRHDPGAGTWRAAAAEDAGAALAAAQEYVNSALAAC